MKNFFSLLIFILCATNIVFSQIKEEKILTITGENSGDFFGYSVSRAGDVNGDGIDDVIIGAYRNDAVYNLSGRAYIFLPVVNGVIIRCYW